LFAEPAYNNKRHCKNLKKVPATVMFYSEDKATE